MRDTRAHAVRAQHIRIFDDFHKATMLRTTHIQQMQIDTIQSFVKMQLRTLARQQEQAQMIQSFRTQQMQHHQRLSPLHEVNVDDDDHDATFFVQAPPPTPIATRDAFGVDKMSSSPLCAPKPKKPIDDAIAILENMAINQRCIFETINE